MNEDELWLSFIKSGSVKDYLSYLEGKNKEVNDSANNDRRPGDKGAQYRG